MPPQVNHPGPGFVTCVFDVPFTLGLPSGHYRAYDPIKGRAAIGLIKREGSRAFYRRRTIVGPNALEYLGREADRLSRPQTRYKYVQTNVKSDGSGETAVLNIHTARDGGYAQALWFTEVEVTFLADSLAEASTDNQALERACSIFNLFLDKYRLLSEDYRVDRVTPERYFYLAYCFTSPLEEGEAANSAEVLFDSLERERTYYGEIGRGGFTIQRTVALESMVQVIELPQPAQDVLINFAREDYSLPLSYQFILESIRSLQVAKDYRLSIIHAQTACEVFIANVLVRLLTHYGTPGPTAISTVDDDREYRGPKKKIDRLEEWTTRWCSENSSPFTLFKDSDLYRRWDERLYAKRNAAIHEGQSAFTFEEAAAALGVAKEVIVFLDSRIPPFKNRVTLNPATAHYTNLAGGIMF